jgi:hypothetical protein
MRLNSLLLQVKEELKVIELREESQKLPFGNESI